VARGSITFANAKRALEFEKYLNASAETHAKGERAIRTVLTVYLEAHPDSRA
jgi:hypothetical protein